MKVFNKDDGAWEDKVNFVDNNNVLLGYDMSEQCCESAGWFISDQVEDHIIEQTESEPELKGFVFDTEFFKDVYGDQFDEGGMAVFRIEKGDEEKFIHLFNCHNGYYSHGFSFQVGSGKPALNGSL